MKLLLKNWLIELKNMEQSLNRVYLNQQDYFFVPYFFVPKKEVFKVDDTDYSIIQTNQVDMLIFNDERKSVQSIKTDLLFRRIENYQTKLERVKTNG